MNKQAAHFSADRLFTGKEWLLHHTITVEDGKITALTPSEKQAAMHAPIIAPAFIDIQIYGAAAKLLAVYPEPASLHALYQYCSRGGASHFQPTVATNNPSVFHACIDAVRAYWKEGGKGCLGLHIEGPWIHPLKKGAHDESFIHSPSVTEATELLEYGKGVISMITLAPEICSREVVSLIQSYGVLVSAGHSNSTYAEAMAAFDAGIPLATHLFNAMSPLQHRAPGMAGAIFNHPTLMCSIVPDGYHVDFAAIQIAKKLMGDRLFVITDAVTETTEGPYPHQLNCDRYESNGTLSGSALTMAKAMNNLVEQAGIDRAEALRMVSTYPAKAMGKENSMGKIAIGYDANLVMLSEGWEVMGIISSN